VGGHGAIESAGGQISQCFDLIAGDAGGAEGLIWGVEEQLRSGIATEVLADAPVDGGRGLAMQLLVKDGFERDSKGVGAGARRSVKGRRNG